MSKDQLRRYKIPYELICYPCGGEVLEWTGLDSDQYLLFQCPKCKRMIGVKKPEE